MSCLLSHDWSWPRRKGGKDVQFCPRCGKERESKVRFEGPRYRRTQDPIPNFIATPLPIEADTRIEETGGIISIAA